MKKLVFLLLSLVILLTVAPKNIYAAKYTPYLPNPETSDTEIIYEDDDIIIECTLISIPPSGIQLFSSQNKTSAKSITIKNTSGNIVATFILTATFSYDGNSSSCTKASHSSSVKDTNWSFTSKSASASGNKATGSYTIKNSSTSKSTSGTVTITCSKTGVIS